MSSEIPVRLPVIDFSKQGMKPGTPEWDLVKVQVRQALDKYGCFEALFDEVLELRKPLFGALEELFDLPLQTKERYISDKLYHGYYGPTAILHESMLIDDANTVENIEQHLTSILWPQGNSSVSKTLLSFSDLASGLEKTIRRMILESFGVEKYMKEHMDCTNYSLRLMKYEGPQSSEPTLRARSHYDQNMVTLLYQNEVNGFEFQTKDGEWIMAKPSPDSFTVLIGESLSIWLNGRLSAPYHRVMMTENKARYCAGLFATPKGGYKVKAPEELVDEQNPLLFKPFDYEEFLGSYSSKVAGSGVKAYCTV